MRRQTRARLADEVAIWRNLGVIDAHLADQLDARYDARGSAGAMILKWLGFFGLFMTAAAILSLVGILVARAGLLASAVAATVATGAIGWAGVRFAVDRRRRYPVLGAALVTLSLVGGYGAAALVLAAFGGEPRKLVGPLLLVVSAAALAVAYALRLRWPLLLGLLCFFHAAGSWHAYAGHGAYFADIADPRAMALIALVAIGLGVYHEQLEAARLPRHVGFGSLYLIFGLLYLDLSLWFLTLPRPTLAWVLLFAGAAAGQIVAGAALKDSRFVGFGIVFLSINLYTRLFENFWDRLSAGSFFALAGLLAMALGFLFERVGSRAPAAA